ncbi:MAG: tetratricopeptide repeat protein [Candidatus Tantalella remota]|nr:tetratricopeptide repeat protein [Candidatus Tantalella remota]
MSKIKLLIFNNLVFILYAVGVVTGFVYLQGMATGFIVLLLPGLGWALKFGAEDNDIIITLLLSVFISFFIFLFGFLGCFLAGITVNQYVFAGVLFIVSNAGILLIRGEKTPAIYRYQMIFFAAVLLLLSLNAKKMPLVYDVDASYMLTSYGLVHEVKPYKNISRVPYAFEHSPGPLMVSASSVFLMGEVDETKEAYFSAKEIEKKYEKDRIWEFWDRIPGTEESKAEVVLSGKKELLFSTRVPQFFLSALLMLILCEIVRRRTGSVFYGIFAATVFLGPEMFVRLSYADYTTSILFISLAMYYVYAYRKKSVFWPIFLGFCAAWINQKTVIVPVAFMLAEMWRMRGKTTVRAAGYLAGWVLGLVTVAVYGYFLNWQCFIRNFLFDHGVTGLLGGAENIPGFFAAWTRAALYMNPVVFLLCMIALGYYLVKARKDRFFVVPVWFFAGAFVFLLCKWPITRNCAVVYPPMFIALGCFIASRGLWVKRGLTIVVGAMFCLNIFVMSDSFVVPAPFYAYRETSNTSATVASAYKDYIGHKARSLFGSREAIPLESRVEPLERFPEASMAYAARAGVHKSLGDTGEALRLYQKSVRLYSGNADANNNMGNILAEQGQSQEAITAYKRAIEIDPGQPGAYLNLGVLYLHEGRTHEAIELYEKAIDLDADIGEAYNNLGNAYRSLKEYDKAIRAYEKAIQIDPRSKDVYFNLGNAYFEAGSLEKAIVPYRKALEIDSADKGAYNNLNIVYRKMGMLDEAVELNKEALNWMTEKGKVYYQLAVIYYRKGDYATAVMYYDKAERGGVGNKAMREALKAYYGADAAAE